MNILNKYVRAIAFTSGLFAASFSFSAFAAPETFDFLTMSDIHLNTYKATSKASSDNKLMMTINPVETIDSNDLDSMTFVKLLEDPQSGIVQEINKNIPNAKFVILLGDTAGHTSSESNRLTYLKSALTQLEISLSIPIFSVMGNNDALEANYGYFTQKNIAAAENPINALNLQDRGAGWINVFLSTGVQCASVYPCLYREEKGDQEGYYSAYLGPGLKFISLNTVLFSSKSSAAHEVDPQELEWFEEQLKDSYMKKESVLVGMHIPPGSGWRSTVVPEYGMSEKYKFFNIIRKYPDTIVGMLAGHTHTDNLKALAFKYTYIDAQGVKRTANDLIPLIYTAGLSTAHGNASSFKNFTMTRKDSANKWAIKDITTYSFLQTNGPVDAGEDTPIQLKRYYNFVSTYCPTAVTLTVNDCMKSHVSNFYRTSGYLAFSDKFKSTVKQIGIYAGNPNNVSTSSYAELIYLQETIPKTV